MKTGSRWLNLLAVICGIWLLVVGCTDDDGDGAAGPADAGGDVGFTGDIGGDVTTCFGTEDCDEGETCTDNICVPAACGNDEACGDEKICRDGFCDEGCRETSQCDPGEVCTDEDRCVAGLAQCAMPGETCDPSASMAIGAGFECVDTAGNGQHTCLAICTPTASDPDGGCASQSICLPTANQSGAPTACFPSNCDGATDDASCADVQAHPFFGSYDNGGSCTALRNDTRYCLPSGTQDEGDACNANSPVLCDPDVSTCNACGTDTRCVDSVCRSVCGSGDDCADSSCVAVGVDGIVGEDAGFCADSCEPFSRGECGSGEGCRVLTTSVGYCGPIGDKGFMESCEPPTAGDPDARECAEGMSCVVYQAGDDGSVEIARCTPVCEAPGEDDPNPRDNDATCGGDSFSRFLYLGASPAAIDIYVDGLRVFDDLATGTVTDGDPGTPGVQYTTYLAGDIEFDVVDGDAQNNNSPLEQVPTILVGGEAITWAFGPDGQGGVQAWLIDDPRGIGQPAAELARVRAVHTVPDIENSQGNDIPVDLIAVAADGDPTGSGATELAVGLLPGASGDFTTLTADIVDLYAFETETSRTPGNELALIEDVSLSGGARTNLFLRGTADDTDAEPLGVAVIEHRNAPDAPLMQCVASGGGATGLCFQDCEFEDYGEATCFSNQNACRPFFDSSGHCLPAGEADGTIRQLGEGCEPADWNPCEEGTFCRQRGNGSGVCSSYCVGDGDFGALACSDSDVCPAEDDALGICETPCTPDANFGDSAACESEFFQACVPENVDDESGEAEGAFCSASGMRMRGEPCGGEAATASLWQNCMPGNLCAYESGTATDPFGGFVARRTGDGAPDPTCRPLCDPFAEGGSSCPMGEACAVNLATITSAEVGVCLAEADVASKETLTPCDQDDLGKACGDGSVCAVNAGENVCLEFCDWETQTGCTGDRSCELPAGGSPIGGVLGLCQ